jgi:hypothetical protein
MARAWHALAAYTALSLVATWPLVRGLGRDVAGDFGDPVLTIWIAARNCDQFLAVLGGDFSRIATFFDAGIFHPAPLTLAYSEHLIPQSLFACPVYALGGNPVLAHNLVFLSTFVLSGLGTYLFVRELTGNGPAAFVAGLLFAFAPYRFPQTPHIQVLSSQWMPFALYGFHRFFVRVQHGERAIAPLAGASFALVLQNLSCAYYLLYFPPFVAAYLLWELVRRGLWRRAIVWRHLALAGALVVLTTVPFLLPYAAVREALPTTRSRGEVIRYSADVYSYATAASTLWSPVMRAYPKPEGDLFPGLIPVMFVLVWLATTWRTATRHLPAKRRWLEALLTVAAAGHLAGGVAALVHRRVMVDAGLIEIQISNVNQMLVRAVVLIGLLLFISPKARSGAMALVRHHGFFLAALLAAIWLTLGPSPQALGRPTEIAAPYAVLQEHVPGFESVRVPARFAMIVVLMLAVIGGLGAAAVAARRWGTIALAVLSAAFFAEGLVMPFPVNAQTPVSGYNTPEPRLLRPARAPGVYREIARQPAEDVVVELPLGEPDFDLRTMYYSLAHGRRLVNGYSGFFPPHYGLLRVALSDVPRQTDGALAALRANGATLVVVHETAYLDSRGADTTAALISRGAIELYRDAGDVLLRLP